jgi:hypothetical protein
MTRSTAETAKVTPHGLDALQVAGRQDAQCRLAGEGGRDRQLVQGTEILAGRHRAGPCVQQLAYRRRAARNIAHAPVDDHDRGGAGASIQAADQ